MAGSRSPLRSPWRLTGALLSLFLAGAMPGRAATFSGLARTLGTGAVTLASPSGLASGPDGTRFLADTANNRIVVVNPQGAAAVLAVAGLGTALSGPQGLALDASGNLFIADTGNSRVVKVTSAGAGSVVATGSVTLSGPRGVALDPSGNLFIADTGNNQVVEVAAGGPAAALAIAVSSGPAALSGPIGLAIDPTGKLFIADSQQNRIITVASGTTTGSVLAATGLGTALSGPSGVALDRIGNLFIADPGNNRIVEVDTAGNGLVQNLGAYSLTLTGPRAVAVDVLGAVLMADTGNNRCLELDLPTDPALASGTAGYSLNRTAVGFGHSQLGTASATTLTLPVTIGAAETIGQVKVLTCGSPNLDFTLGAGTTATGGTTNASAAVEVSFLPTAPGLRRGAVVIFNNAAPQAPILTIPLAGFADAPLAVLSPSVGSVIGTGGVATANPYQVALDGAGNLYCGVYSSSAVIKVPAGGGSASVVALGTPGSIIVRNITGVALDGAGNLFIGDHQNSRILVVTPSGVVSVLGISGLSPALGFPTALAFDPAGNLLIADFSNGRIIQVSSLLVAGAASSGRGAVLRTGTYAFGSGNLTGMAVDPAGAVYAAARTQNTSHIVKVTAAGAASLMDLTAVSPAVNNPQGVAADAFGNIYVVDTTNNRIVKVTAAGTPSIVALSGLPGPATTLGPTLFGVTADPVGNLYISDWTNNRIVYANVGGAAMGFASTRQGSTSTDSPRTATVTNLGDQDLAFSADPAYTADFSQNSADSNPVTATTVLAPGSLANVSVKFTPQSVGSLSATIPVTSNTLNVSGSVQQVAVSGTGTNPGDTTSTTVAASPASLYTGQSATLTATVADTTAGHTAAVPTGAVNFIDTVGSTITTLGSASLSGGHAALSGIVLAGAGTHTLTATYAGVSGTYLTSNGSTTVVLSPAVPTTVALVSSIPGTAHLGDPVTFTATVGNAISTTPTGSVDFLDGSTVLGTVALTGGAAAFPISTLALGDHGITASYSGDSADLAAASSVVDQVIAVQEVVIPTPPPAAVAGPDGIATTTLTLASHGTLTAPITFTVTGLPPATTISFDHPAVTLGANPQAVVTVTLATTPRLRIIGRNHGFNPYEGLGAGALLGCGIFALPFGRRKRRFGIFLSALALVLAGGLTACSSGSSSRSITTGAAGTPAGTYTVTVAADSAGATGATSTIQLTVD